MIRLDLTIGIATITSALIAGGNWGVSVEKRIESGAQSVKYLNERQDRLDAEIQRRLSNIESKVDRLIERGAK